MKLEKATSADFEKIYSSMEKNFVKEELRDYSDAAKLLGKEDYSVYKISTEENDVGFITVWELCEFAFAEHFVIYEEFRNRGYGALALDLIKEKFTRVVLEVELPTEEMPKRRIAFYKRQGFVENGKPYIQPPYRKGEAGVALIIMSYPDALSDFEGAVKEIYSKVYNVN